MKYHPILNSNSGISRAAFDGDKTIYLQFPNATYEYVRGNADALWSNLVNVKALAASLTDEEKAEMQPRLTHTIGSEGSYCLKLLVGPRKEPYPNRRLSAEEASLVWGPTDEEANEAARDEEAAYAKESLTAGSQPRERA